MEEGRLMLVPQRSSNLVTRADGTEQPGTPDDPIKVRTKGFVKIAGRVIGVCAAVFVLLARDGFGPPYLDSVGKALFWTGLVLVPLFSFNYDILRLTSGKAAVATLSVLQLVLVLYLFERLQEVNFIILAPICIVQCLLFFLPLMLIRKRHSGIWY